jgi:hypothetical protein
MKSILQQTKNPFSVFCINCQSLNSNIDLLKELITDVCDDKFQFDIIGITETFKIHKSINYDMDGFNTTPTTQYT